MVRIGCCAFVCGFFLQPDGRAADLVGVGFLPGASTSYATAISRDGRVVVGYAESKAFIWTADDGLRELPARGAVAVDSSGTKVAGWSYFGWEEGTKAVTWTATDGTINIGPPGWGYSYANGLSADGRTVVGVVRTGLAYRSARWRDGNSYEVLLPRALPGGEEVADSSALGVSADGSVIVGWGSTNAGDRAFRWTEGARLREVIGALPAPAPAQWSHANAVNRDGNAVVGDSRLGSMIHPFRWTVHGGMIDLGLAPNLSKGGFASGVSGCGSVVVGWGLTAESHERAAIWTPTEGMRDLNDLLPAMGVDLSGWVLIRVTGVSDDGSTVCGWGLHNGVNEGWVARLRPYCSSDLDSNGIVDDADFSLFVASYSELTCTAPSMPRWCPADLFVDGLVNDSDFQVFARAYDALLCPE